MAPWTTIFLSKQVCFGKDQANRDKLLLLFDEWLYSEHDSFECNPADQGYPGHRYQIKHKKSIKQKKNRINKKNANPNNVFLDRSLLLLSWPCRLRVLW